MKDDANILRYIPKKFHNLIDSTYVDVDFDNKRNRTFQHYFINFTNGSHLDAVSLKDLKYKFDHLSDFVDNIMESFESYSNKKYWSNKNDISIDRSIDYTFGVADKRSVDSNGIGKYEFYDLKLSSDEINGKIKRLSKEFPELKINISPLYSGENDNSYLLTVNESMKTQSIVNKILSGKSIRTSILEAMDMYGMDDSFFTKEDLVEFAYDVEDEVNEKFKSVNSPFEVHYSGVWVEDDDRTITIDYVCYPNETDYSTSIKVDMRSIQAPMDLYKYKDSMVDKIIDNINNSEVVENKSITEKSLKFFVKDPLNPKLTGSIIKAENGDEIEIVGMSYKDVGDNIKSLPKTPEMEKHYTEDFNLTGVGGKSYIVTREVIINKSGVKGPRFKSKIIAVNLNENMDSLSSKQEVLKPWSAAEDKRSKEIIKKIFSYLNAGDEFGEFYEENVLQEYDPVELKFDGYKDDEVSISKMNLIYTKSWDENDNRVKKGKAVPGTIYYVVQTDDGSIDESNWAYKTYADALHAMNLYIQDIIGWRTNSINKSV